MGWRDAAKTELSRSKPDDFLTAIVLLYLGEVDSALSALERAASKPEFKRIYLRLDPDWDAVRNDPRFQKLVTTAR
jgi:hypothetical protein